MKTLLICTIIFVLSISCGQNTRKVNKVENENANSDNSQFEPNEPKNDSLINKKQKITELVKI
ncbi:hypothetical protein ACFLTE_10270, partial [Bacteroidota bacterium]